MAQCSGLRPPVTTKPPLSGSDDAHDVNVSYESEYTPVVEP